MPEYRYQQEPDCLGERPAWPGRLAAGLALGGVILLWLLMLPFAALAFAWFGMVRWLRRNERLRRVCHRG